MYGKTGRHGLVNKDHNYNILRAADYTPLEIAPQVLDDIIKDHKYNLIFETVAGDITVF
jgi:hypothetical protein